MDRPMTVDVVALFCGVSAKTVRRAIERGDLDAARLGGHGALRIRPAAIDEWFVRRSTGERHAGSRSLRWRRFRRAEDGAASGSRPAARGRGHGHAMSERPAKPKVPRGVEARWHAGRAVWTFRVRWADPVSGERRSQEFDTVDDALDYQAYLRLARRRGALDELSRGRVVLSEFVEDDWWPNHAGRRLSRHTLTAYSQVWNRNLLPRVGHLELRQITTPTVQTLREALEADGLGPATVRKSPAVLQSICAHAVRKGELTINPVSAVRKPAAKRAVVIDPFCVEEVEGLLAALRDRASHPSQWMLAELIAYSGARPQDALALSYGGIGTRRIVYAEKNVDGRIVAGSKTGADRARSVTLLASLRKDLLAFRLAAGNPPEDALVLRGPDGEPWRLHDYKNWQRNAVKSERSTRPASIFAAAAAAIGRSDATPYFLRHT
jgi:excisionase family DNA binding protein